MKTKTFNLIGISTATICLIHCLLFPLLIVIPLGISHNPYIDLGFALIGLLAVYSVQKNHAIDKKVKWILWSSIALVFLSVFLDLFFHIHSVLIYIGALGLISGHILNYRNHKRN